MTVSYSGLLNVEALLQISTCSRPIFKANVSYNYCTPWQWANKAQNIQKFVFLLILL